ncbi:MAG: glycosyltransferase [Parvularculaceae bacterium]|nr:glycosyltransferase [Parvularculaceae bacterium]
MRVVVLARWPEPGRCKTRMIPALGPEGAADLHKRLAEMTIETVKASGLALELWGTGADEAAFQDWLGPVTFRQQAEGDLGERLLAASAPEPVMFLGTDAPDLSPGLLHQAADGLVAAPCAIGPAEDGGYWTLAIGKPAPSLFSDMPWGTETVYETTRKRIDALGWQPVILPTLSDLDRPEDLERWPELKP